MNTPELTRLRDELHRLADAPGDAPRTDIELARTRGRRIVRTRRAVAVTAPALAIAVAAGSVMTVLAADEAARSGEVAANSERPALPSPFVKRASFGWLPAGFAIVGMGVHAGGGFSIAATGSGGRGVHFSLFPPGPEPTLGKMRGGVAAKPTPVAPIGGRTAHWMQPPSPGPGTASGEARLRVQYGTRQWAEVEVYGFPQDQVVTTVRRVADQIRLRAEPAALPLRITGFPRRFTAGEGSLDTRHAKFGTNLTLSFSPSLTISLRPDTQDLPTPAGEKRARTPNINIGGYRATHRTEVRGKLTMEMLHVYGVKGYNISFYTTSKETIDLLRPSGGLVGLFKRTTVLGADESRWTTTPLTG